MLYVDIANKNKSSDRTILLYTLLVNTTCRHVSHRGSSIVRVLCWAEECSRFSSVDKIISSLDSQVPWMDSLCGEWFSSLRWWLNCCTLINLTFGLLGLQCFEIPVTLIAPARKSKWLKAFRSINISYIRVCQMLVQVNASNISKSKAVTV